MSEEEILKECTELAENEHHELGDCWDEEYSSSAIFGLIMLYKQTKKELNNLKEIEQSHQEENGKLRVKLEQYKRLAEMNLKDAEEFQNNMCEHRCILYNEIEELRADLFEEKEKNKVLEAKRIWNKGRIEELKKELEQEKEKNKEYEKQLDLDYVEKNFISKDKIKEKIEELLEEK